MTAHDRRTSVAGRRATALAVAHLMIGVGAAQAAAKTVCYRSDGVLVVARERSSEVGQDILARTRPAPATSGCAYAPRSGDWIVGKGQPDNVLALRGKFLILDRGTGPDRTLLVLDVASRATLVEAGYDDGEGRLGIADDGVTFWRVGPAALPVTGCPMSWRSAADNKDAKRAHPVSQVRFDFATRRVEETGRKDCLRTQDDMD